MVSVSALPAPVVLPLGSQNHRFALPRRGGWVGITSSWSCREELHQEMTSEAGGGTPDHSGSTAEPSAAVCVHLQSASVSARRA